MLLQSTETFGHLQNTNQDILDEIRELCLSPSIDRNGQDRDIQSE